VIDRSPEILDLTIDLNEDLAQMPTQLDVIAMYRNPLVSDLGSEDWSDAGPPDAYCLMADVDPTLVEQILDLSKRQWKTDIHHHRQPNDIR